MTRKRFTNIEHDYENAWIKCNDNGDFMIYAIYKELDESLPSLEDLLNGLSEENEQLRKDATTLIYSNQEYRRENDKIKSILLNKVEELNKAYDESARAGMPTGGIIGELDSFEEICRIMGWIE